MSLLELFVSVDDFARYSCQFGKRNCLLMEVRSDIEQDN